VGRVALNGTAAPTPAAMGGGSAEVVSPHVTSLLSALSDRVAVTYAVGADPRSRIPAAGRGFSLRAVFRDGDGRALAEEPLAGGTARWLADLPEGVDAAELRSIEVAGAFTPETTGAHRFAVTGIGEFRLELGGRLLFHGVNETAGGGSFDAAFLNPPSRIMTVELDAGAPVAVSLRHVVEPATALLFINFVLGHAEPEASADEMIAEAAAAAASADAAVVVVGTTDEDEREGRDRESLALPGRQDELVERVAAANPRTVVVVNVGSPVELPWADRVAAVLLAWFPGQEGGTALADVLLGVAEPGGRLPTTWPARLADCPVRNVTPTGGALRYEEGVFIGYRAWERSVATPAFWFGHGLGYTTWAYESASFAAGSGGGDALGVLRVRVRNTGERAGREVVQAYLAPRWADPERPVRWLAGFADAVAAPGEAVEVEIAVPRRAAESWDVEGGGWRPRPGSYAIETGRSYADRRLVTEVAV
jgi:beta-glucosidase